MMRAELIEAFLRDRARPEVRPSHPLLWLALWGPPAVMIAALSLIAAAILLD